MAPVSPMRSGRDEKKKLVSPSKPKPMGTLLESPTAEHRALAQGLGLDVTDQWARFIDHYLAEGRTLKDRDAGFRRWLRTAGDLKRGGKPDDGSVPLGALWGKVI